MRELELEIATGSASEVPRPLNMPVAGDTDQDLTKTAGWVQKLRLLWPPPRHANELEAGRRRPAPGAGARAGGLQMASSKAAPAAPRGAHGEGSRVRARRGTALGPAPRSPQQGTDPGAIVSNCTIPGRDGRLGFRDSRRGALKPQGARGIKGGGHSSASQGLMRSPVKSRLNRPSGQVTGPSAE